jgi:hypothetical protein
MHDTTSNTLKEIIIYTNTKISLNFYQEFKDGLNPIQLNIKTLGEIPTQVENKIYIVMLDHLDEIDQSLFELNHIHLILPKAMASSLQHNLRALVFAYAVDETPQYALEQLYDHLIKFYCSREYYLDPQDFFTACSTKHGASHININTFDERDTSYKDLLRRYLKSIPTTHTVSVNFLITETIALDSYYFKLIEDVVDDLEYNPARDVFFSVIFSQHQDARNTVSIINFS